MNGLLGGIDLEFLAYVRTVMWYLGLTFIYAIVALLAAYAFIKIMIVFVMYIYRGDDNHGRGV